MYLFIKNMKNEINYFHEYRDIRCSILIPVEQWNMDQPLLCSKNYIIPFIYVIVGACIQELNTLSLVITSCRQIINFRWRHVKKLLHLHPSLRNKTLQEKEADY
jgi:hypothetical protein